MEGQVERIHRTPVVEYLESQEEEEGSKSSGSEEGGEKLEGIGEVLVEWCGNTFVKDRREDGLGVKGISFPVTGSTKIGSIPKNGRVADPGFVPMAPGSGVKIMDPVSVCQYVSTTLHLSFPITL